MAEVTLEEAPRKAREHFEKGLAALERNNLDYAMDMFDSALELCPALLKARQFLLRAAIKKLKAGKVSGLTHTMSSLSGLGGVFQAQAQIKKKPEDAVKTISKLLRKDPLNLQFVNLMAQAAKAANMPEVAVLTLEIARENYPSDVKLLETLGALFQDVDRMHDARLVYEELVRLRPSDPDAVRRLKDATALDSMQKGRWNEAKSYRDVIKDTKESVRLEQESKAVKTGKDIEDLITETLGKIQREPQNVNYKRSLADLYAKADRFDEALEVLREAQAASGGSDPQVDRSISQIMVRKLDAGITAAEASGDAAAAEAARISKETFMLSDAEDRVKRYPNDLLFKYELGVIYYERERYNEAAQMLQLSTRNPQRRIRSLYYLALCFKAKGQMDLASEQLEKAAAELNVMDETKKDVLYELGNLNEAMGNNDKAATFYKEIYSVDISYRDVSKKIEKFYKK